MGIINRKSSVTNYMLIMVGTILLAISINVFFDKLGMVVGGVTGIAIIIKKITEPFIGEGVPIWISNLVINIPLFLLGIFVKGRAFGRKTIFATFFLSFALYITQFIPSITQDILLGCIFGSILSGLGLGMVFLAQATTGGTDLAASILQHFIKFVSISKLLLIIDGMIIVFGLLVFGPEKTMYSLISAFITVKVIDAIVEGLYFAKAAFIITDRPEEVSKELLIRLDRGLTGLHGEGMYTGLAKKVLLCVVSQRQIVQLKDIVKDIDQNAFVIVADVREVLGEGFLE